VALPAVGRRMIGPFIFFDQMGPAEFLLGQGIDVRAAPPHRARHRHLSLRRRDRASRFGFGFVEPIRPGASTS